MIINNIYIRNIISFHLLNIKNSYILLNVKKCYSVKIKEIEKNILNYYIKENEIFAKKRKIHESQIKEYIKENDKEFMNILLPKDNINILNDNVDEITKNIKSICKIKTLEEIKNISDKIKLIKVLTVSGIRINSKIILYYFYDILKTINKYFETYQDCVIKFEEIKELNEYTKLNCFYYKNNIYDNFFILFESLSNIIYSICENFMENNEIHLYIKKQIDTYLNIDDIIKKSPSFLNISILFYYINYWLFVDRSNKIKNDSLTKLNLYLNCISNDEINLKEDDLFYLFLTIRLIFLSYTYNNVINNLNKFSKDFLLTFVLFPHNSEIIYDQNEKEVKEIYNYKDIINYLNKYGKYIENKPTPILPFYIPLSSLKNKIIYVYHTLDDYYQNDDTVLRAYVYWKYYIAHKEEYKLISLCDKNEYKDLLVKGKREEILTKCINKDHIYNLEIF